MELHQEKYRTPTESFEEGCYRQASTLSDNPQHFKAYNDILLNQRFLNAGRVQAAVGALKRVTPYNCFVSRKIPDSMEGIMDSVKEAAEIMRLGGGIGYDFSTLRPRGSHIVSLDSHASGPVSFMQIFDATCQTIAASGHRRGAQMAVLRVDHPDIEEFIEVKHDLSRLTAFNVSVGVTDKFMDCVVNNEPFELTFRGTVHKVVSAKSLWEKIMRSTWDYAEPGVLFIDRINSNNALAYAEHIYATNPCGEQPLPAYGACLLGSFNLTKYIYPYDFGYAFDYNRLAQDAIHVVRATDNIIDIAVYPYDEHKREATTKRRMGLGVTGLANALETMGHPYGSEGFLKEQESILSSLANVVYSTSAELAEEKGPFPLWSQSEYGNKVDKNHVWKNIDPSIKTKCRMLGLRNSHLLSIAPTGTISLTADNISSSIEPVFSTSFDRVIQTPNGPRVERVEDYAHRKWGTVPRTASECTVDEHLNVQLLAQKWVDSAVSKTCNVGDDVSWDDFKDIYMKAWKGGAKGCTTFRAAGKRMGILTSTEDQEPLACTIDERGNRSCE